MLDFLSEHLKRKGFELRENYNLKADTYIKVDTVASLVVYPEDEERLVEVLRILSQTDVPHRVLGRISNVLFRNLKYDGVIIKTDRINDISVSCSSVRLGCGCFFPMVVKHLARKNLGGFEGLCGIPGSAGGMIKQNAGAFGYEVSDRFVDCTAYDCSNAQIVVLDLADMHFGYRTSVMNNKNFVILSAEFEAEFMPESEIISKINQYSDIRRKTQPVNFPSLGSVFKKADGVGAGYYVDKLGLKGFSRGGATVSDKHAGFILNSGNASSEDVLSLIEYIKERVLLEFGVALEEEIEII